MNDSKKKDDLKLIKDKYGEKMMHLCRKLFPTILETKGLLFEILSRKFQYSRELHDDIVREGRVNSFRDFVYMSATRIEAPRDEEEIRTPFEILKEAGYTLYECRTEAEIQQFRKYYDPGEVLCTFNGGRLNDCFVFFAVKDNVDKIRRDDFPNPQREDEYGTSVLSIQFSRGVNNYVSIKNRYNHTITREQGNPDATYGNELDNIGGIIMPNGRLDSYGKSKGLTSAFRNRYGFNITLSSAMIDIPGYIEASDGKTYKYNYRINDRFYCSDNIIIENYPLNRVSDRFINKDDYLVFDYFVLDIKNKKVIPADRALIGNEGFFNVFIENTFDKLSIVKNKEDNTKTITFENNDGKVVITVDRHNRMVSYYDDITKVIDPKFFSECSFIKKIDLPNAEYIRNEAFKSTINLEYFNAPKVKKIYSHVLEHTLSLKELNMPELETVGDDSLRSTNIETIELPNLKHAGKNFLHYSEQLKRVSLPKLESVGAHSLEILKELEELDISSLSSIGNCCLCDVPKLKVFDAPNLEVTGVDLLKNNIILEVFNAPKLKKVRRGTLLKHKDVIPNEIEKEEEPEITPKPFNPLDFLNDRGEIHVDLNGGRHR